MEYKKFKSQTEAKVAYGVELDRFKRELQIIFDRCPASSDLSNVIWLTSLLSMMREADDRYQNLKQQLKLGL